MCIYAHSNMRKMVWCAHNMKALMENGCIAFQADGKLSDLWGEMSTIDRQEWETQHGLKDKIDRLMDQEAFDQFVEQHEATLGGQFARKAVQKARTSLKQKLVLKGAWTKQKPVLRDRSGAVGWLKRNAPSSKKARTSPPDIACSSSQSLSTSWHTSAMVDDTENVPPPPSQVTQQAKEGVPLAIVKMCVVNPVCGPVVTTEPQVENVISRDACVYAYLYLYIDIHLYIDR